MIERDRHPRMFGEIQAHRRAGPWPRSGTVAEYEAATERAVKAARRCRDIGVRWSMRYRLWEPPQCDDPRVELNTTRLMARRALAVDIADERRFLLARLTADPRGCA